MVCWMASVNKDKTISFEEFIKQAAFFFSQRHHEEGLRYIFELYDKERKGSLDEKTFRQVCEDLGVFLSNSQQKQFFNAASEDGKSVSFQDFAKTMRRENYH